MQYAYVRLIQRVWLHYIISIDIHIYILIIDILIILAVRVYEVVSVRCFGFGVVTK